MVGPENELGQVTRVQTDPIDLSRLTGSAELRVNTYVPNAGAHIAPLAQVRIKVEISSTQK